MATRCNGSSSGVSTTENASLTAASIEFISRVPPLFDDTTTSVVRGSASARMPRRRTGESESSTRNFIPGASSLKYFVMVMAACVEPPWPMRTASLKPWSMKYEASAVMSASGQGGLLAKSVQPMKLAEHSSASFENEYSVASLACTRLAARSSTSVCWDG